MLSKQEAYAAMFAFLEHWFGLTKSDELGALLGSMSLLPDGRTADPALWEDWCAAVERAKSGAVRLDMELK
jgi:hypothetical protein